MQRGKTVPKNTTKNLIGAEWHVPKNHLENMITFQMVKMARTVLSLNTFDSCAGGDGVCSSFSLSAAAVCLRLLCYKYELLCFKRKFATWKQCSSHNLKTFQIKVFIYLLLIKTLAIYRPSSSSYSWATLTDGGSPFFPGALPANPPI